MTRARKLRLSLHLLRGFEASARHLSFTRAARELHITQSAISREVKRLEDQLRRQLFKRTKRGLMLTEAGEALYHASRNAMGTIDDVVGSLHGAGTRGASIAITASVPFTTLWLAPRLRRFTGSFPHIDLRISATNAALDLERERLDIGIRHSPSGVGAPDALRLLDDRVLPVCSPSLLRNRSRPLKNPDDLARHTLLYFDSVDRGRWPWLDWTRWLDDLGLRGMMPAGALRFSHFEHAIQAAIDGVGVALGRTGLNAASLREGALVAPFACEPKPMGSYFILVRPGARDNAAVKAVAAWLLEEAGRDSSG